MNYRKFSGAASAALMTVIVILILVPGAAAGKYKTLYKFKGGADGRGPIARLIFDQAGNLYSMTSSGGADGGGVVFELIPNADGSWKEKVLHYFNGTDGNNPWAGLIFDQAGNLYGTTNAGGNPGPGMVFELTPNADGSWSEDVLYSFCSLTDCDDGRYAEASVIFDASGNLYGTTVQGGGSRHCGGGCGVVYQLTPNAGGSWTESVLFTFTGAKNGDSPSTGSLVFDQAGNLYGTTTWGGGKGGCSFYGCGTVFQLTPNPDGSWDWKALHRFTGEGGGQIWGGLIFDSSGNLYGTTFQGGNLSQCGGDGCGVVFKLAPNPEGSWKETVLHRFTGSKDGANPYAEMIFDAAGNLYGTTYYGGDYGNGVVFELTPNANGGWREKELHQFTGGKDGANPQAGLIFDAAGNLYGTASGGGKGYGVVFEITP